ncbi:histidine phosphatase superfamily [Microdochium bolleyi]|uniref:Histidine phosphatase superfamily n=1 Tax=Microdochium bolleyi TaxID=196109 RepID=A0A136IQB0_9PEZI|nr:histidine phosphatase superfamily [Microdochium bolleyi]
MHIDINPTQVPRDAAVLQGHSGTRYTATRGVDPTCRGSLIHVRFSDDATLILAGGPPMSSPSSVSRVRDRDDAITKGDGDPAIRSPLSRVKPGHLASATAAAAADPRPGHRPDTLVLAPVLTIVSIYLLLLLLLLLVVGKPAAIMPLQPAMAAAAALLATTAAAAAAATGAANTTTGAAQVDLNWYPPSSSQVNNLTTALTTPHGVYGFVFNTSQTTPGAAYGTYNWCNMPHARAREYPAAKGGYKLKYVEVMQRHHKRTPYASNSFPVESYPWNCDDQGLFFYGAPFGNPTPLPPTPGPAHGPRFAPGPPPGAGSQPQSQSARTYWRGTVSPINPFTAKGWQGTCQFPQITSGGLDDSFVHGDDLYRLYHDKLGFLPGRSADPRAWQDKVAFRVTNNVITSQVAGMFIAGMYEVSPAAQIPLIIQASGVDSLEPQYSCPTASSLFSKIKSSSDARWQDHLAKSAQLIAKLDAISGVQPSPNDGGFHASFDHYFDNLSARQCHAKALPCKIGGGSGDCVTQDLADAVYRLGQWEYSHIYRDAGADTLTAAAASIGVWVAELAAHLRARIAGEGSLLYMHNFAHDGSTSRLLSVLQIDAMVWPGMGSEIVFELYQKTGAGTWHVRVLFGGKVLKSSNPSLGVMDMLPAETLLAYFDGLVGKNASLVKGKCGA